MNASPEQTIALWKKNFIQKHAMTYAEDHLEIAATNRVALQVELSGVELYPVFQLRPDRTPYPVMKEILRIADVYSVEDWTVAFWFDTPNKHDSFNRTPLEFVEDSAKLLAAFTADVTTA